MPEYDNAPAPHSALFDNAPAVTTATVADARPSVTTSVVPQTLTVHLTPATRIAQVRGGRWVPVDVLMQYGRPVPLELALRRVAIGRTVFVAREDAGRVMETLLRSGSAG